MTTMHVLHDLWLFFRDFDEMSAALEATTYAIRKSGLE